MLEFSNDKVIFDRATTLYGGKQIKHLVFLHNISNVVSWTLIQNDLQHHISMQVLAHSAPVVFKPH